MASSRLHGCRFNDRFVAEKFEPATAYCTPGRGQEGTSEALGASVAAPLMILSVEFLEQSFVAVAEILMFFESYSCKSLALSARCIS